jgi:predicted secreted hydrolase
MSNFINNSQNIVFKLLIVVSLVLAGCSGEAPPAAASAGSSRLADLLRADPEAGYALAIEARPFDFPRDHGPHPGYRNEWWYFTGNLDDSEGRRFGYELTIFRFALVAPASPLSTAPVSTANGPRSDWRSDEVFIGHFAVSDVDEERFHVAERYARAALGLAGATETPTRVWVEDWSISRRGADDVGDAAAASETWQIEARQDDIGISLSLTPLKAPVLNGTGGLSQKSAEVGNASYYYSVPRLHTEGTLSVAGDVVAVSGLSWLDREWGSSGLAACQQGWDWFALQLADGSDLMFYQLRRKDGTADRWSAGTWSPAHGEPVHLAQHEVTIEVRDFWDSPLGGRYPMAWTLRVPVLGLDLRVDPALKAQELATTVRYWEGAVDVTGQRNGQPVRGRGYVELTGYAESVP